ncbi:hypothetical protein ABXT32_18905, partial [Ralstonia sp. SM1865_UCD525_TZ5]
CFICSSRFANLPLTGWTCGSFEHHPKGRFFSFCICQVARKIEPTSGRRHNDIIPKMKKGLQALTCKPFHILVGRA